MNSTNDHSAAHALNRSWRTLIHPVVHILGQPLNPTQTTSTSAWEIAWTFHVAIFSLCFSIVSIYAVYGIIRSQNRKDKVTRVLAYVIHTLIGLLGLTRLLTLSVFYNEIVAISVRDRPSVLSRIVFGVGFPCITAAFALVQFSFTEALKGRLSDSKLSNFAFIGFVISGHFLVVLTVEILTTLLRNLVLLFFATKLYFLVLTAITMVRILYSGCMLLSHASDNKRALRNWSVHYGATSSTRTRRTEQPARKTSTAEQDMVKSLRKVKIIMILTSAFCSVICVMEIYSIIELAGIVVGKDGALAPWPWYAYQTLFRLAELGMAGTILYTLAPPGQVMNAGEKRRLLWEFIFGSKEKTDKQTDKVADENVGHPMAVLNRAYNLGNEN